MKFYLQKARNRMKQQAIKKRNEMEFFVGDLIYVKLQPYSQQSVFIRFCLKLSAKFFRPYEVIEKVGKVSYKLTLPTRAKVYPIFHVSQLKKQVGQPYVSPNFQPWM